MSAHGYVKIEGVWRLQRGFVAVAISRADRLRECLQESLYCSIKMNIINTKSNIKSIKFSVTKMIMEYFGDLFNKQFFRR